MRKSSLDQDSLLDFSRDNELEFEIVNNTSNKSNETTYASIIADDRV